MVLLLSMFAVCFANRNVVEKRSLTNPDRSLSVETICEILVFKIHCTCKMDDQEGTVQKSHIRTTQISAVLI